MGPLLARWNAIFVATINKADDITGKQCQARMFRVNRPDYSDAAVVMPWLATRKETKWAIVGADIAWGRNSGSSFKKAADATGKTIVSENYPAFGSNDYAAHIQKVADSGAEALWVALAGRDAINFAMQAKQFGLFDKVVTGGVSFTTDGTVKVLGDKVAGINSIINYSSTSTRPATRSWWPITVKYPGTVSPPEADLYRHAGDVPGGQEGRQRRRRRHKAMEGATFDTILGKQLMREDHRSSGRTTSARWRWRTAAAPGRQHDCHRCRHAGARRLQDVRSGGMAATAPCPSPDHNRPGPR
jgi:branched-chain amino acid transport system substrate-binding protein